MEVLNVREINKIVPLEETLIRQWVNIEEYETLQAELEALRKLLGRWLAGEESVGCKCTICNDTRKFLKGR